MNNSLSADLLESIEHHWEEYLEDNNKQSIALILLEIISELSAEQSVEFFQLLDSEMDNYLPKERIESVNENDYIKLNKKYLTALATIVYIKQFAKEIPTKDMAKDFIYKAIMTIDKLEETKL